MVTKTYILSNLCDSSVSSESTDSCDSSDRSDSSDSSDSSNSSDQKKLSTKKTPFFFKFYKKKITKKKFHQKILKLNLW